MTQQVSLVRQLGVLSAAALVVSNMVGTGIFTTTGYLAGDLGDPKIVLGIWIVGAIIAMAGAFCYSELGVNFPSSGGEYVYLTQAYGPAWGFMTGWTSFFAGFSAPIAANALAFAKYLGYFFPELGTDAAYFRIGFFTVGPAQLVASSLIIAMTLVNFAEIKVVERLQNGFTVFKVAVLVALIVLGFTAGQGNWANLSQTTARTSSLPMLQQFFVSLCFIFASYSGWNAATYISGEIKDPQRNVPRSLIMATLIVTVLYVLLNAAFLYSTPVAKLANQVKVGLIAGTEIFGPSGGKIVGALVCLGLISAVSAMMWIGPRVTMVMGEDVSLLRFFAHKTKNGVPARALIVQTLVATFLLFTGTFEKVVLFIQFSFTLCSFLAVLGVIVLRFTQPGLPRPYRTWGYPVTPVIFMAITLWMLVFQLIDKPMESLLGLAMMLAGLVIYAFSAMLKPRPA